MENTLNFEQNKVVLSKSVRNLIFIIGSIMFWILIVLRNFDIVKLPHQVILIYSMIFLLSMDEKQQKTFVLSSITFRNGFQTNYLILFYLVIYLIKHYKTIKINSLFIVIMLMLIWELFHLIYPESSIKEYIRFMAFYVLLAFVVISDGYYNDFDYVFRVFGIYAIIAFFIILLNTYHYFGSNIIDAFSHGYRLGFGFESLPPMYLFVNANAAGTICNIAIMGLLITIKNKKVIDYLLIIGLIVTGALSISRTYIIVLSLIFILYILLNDMKFTKKLYNILLMFIIIGLAFCFIKNYIPEIIDSFFSRFNNIENNNFGNRNILFSDYNKIIFNDLKILCFGIGTQNILSKLNPCDFSVEFNVPHNGFQEILLCWGIVGLILTLIMFILMIYYAIKRNRDFSVLNLVPMFIFFVDIQTGQFITSNGGILMLIIVYNLLFIPTKKYKSDRCK